MPCSRRDSLTSSEFQPTCGTFIQSANRSHRPGNVLNPDVSGDSLLPSKSHCKPTQMPRNGAPLWTRSVIVLLNPCSSRKLVAEKYPTPGSTSLSACRTVAGSDVAIAFAPTACNAFITEVRLPAL